MFLKAGETIAKAFGSPRNRKSSMKLLKVVQRVIGGLFLKDYHACLHINFATLQPNGLLQSKVISSGIIQFMNLLIHFRFHDSEHSQLLNHINIRLVASVKFLPLFQRRNRFID